MIGVDLHDSFRHPHHSQSPFGRGQFMLQHRQLGLQCISKVVHTRETGVAPASSGSVFWSKLWHSFTEWKSPPAQRMTSTPDLHTLNKPINHIQEYPMHPMTLYLVRNRAYPVTERTIVIRMECPSVTLSKPLVTFSCLLCDYNPLGLLHRRCKEKCEIPVQLVAFRHALPVYTVLYFHLATKSEYISKLTAHYEIEAIGPCFVVQKRLANY
jgi:hypothetical protein